MRTAGCQYMGVSYYPDWYAVSWLRCVLCAEFEQAVSEVADVVLLIAYGTEPFHRHDARFVAWQMLGWRRNLEGGAGQERTLGLP